ncbi:MAG: queuosine precursor transporter [Defluviitaleaceae bacterium]|nr:queuosine precursor transporter [Defluviitaleaceae bacterium]
MDNRNLVTGKPKPLLVYLVAFYAASLLIANILANHMLVFVNWTVSAGILTFPITYILASVISEVYGYSWARRAAWVSLALNALLAGLIQLSIVLPQPYWYSGVYFVAAVGGTWRIVLASLIAFTIGKFANDRIFARLRSKRLGLEGLEHDASHTSMEGFGFRAMASSIAGHILDSAIFSLIAFALILPWGAVFEMIIVSVCLKWGYEWLALPLTVKITKKVSAYERN